MLRVRTVEGDERLQVEELVFCDGAGELRSYATRIATLAGLSAAIAAFGLIRNSGAVVIGAMLVSPLMQPLIGLGLALVGVHRRRQLVSVALIAFATAESFAVGAGAAALLSHVQSVTTTDQILERTAPNVLDLAIACAAGAAGAYVTVRRRAAGALPGAAIAVALAPPITAVGILLEQGHDRLAGGAALLFVTNLLGVIVCSAAVLTLAGFARHRHIRKRDALTIAAPVAILAAVAYPLMRASSTAYRQARDQSVARQVLVAPLRAQHLGIDQLSLVEESGGRLAVSADVVGPTPPTGQAQLAGRLAQALQRRVELILRYVQRQETVEVAEP